MQAHHCHTGGKEFYCNVKTFLQELASKLYSENPNLDRLVLIFPNRRAILYFQKHLSAQLTRPAFAPQMLTIEDFISGFSSSKIPDKLELVHRLYYVYNEVSAGGTRETFDQFYFWGEMLLRDFEEVDKYMVSARHLFQDLSMQKELDSSFDFLTEEQREFLRTFWGNFDEHINESKRKFLRTWKELFSVYEQFKIRLQEFGLAYEGMMHRQVAEQLIQTPGLVPERFGAGRSFHFVGFNALTKTEEVIISAMVSNEMAAIHWDMDAYYVNNSNQEAGRFLREYQQNAILKSTFPLQIPAHLHAASGKRINLYGAAQPVGQAKLMAQVLQEELLKGAVPEDTLVVLPDEKLLMPVLNGISHRVDKLNVTMGFPLTSTPVFNLMELVIELQLHRKGNRYNHRQVLSLLGHPYIVADNTALSRSKRKKIINENLVYVDQRTLAVDSVLHHFVFRPASAIRDYTGSEQCISLVVYLRELLVTAGSIKGLLDIDREYIFHFIRLLNRQEGIMGEEILASLQEEQLDERAIRKKERDALKSFLRLFKQIVNTEKIPFTGEPLRGLQIMGVLETRNLDYKNVYILSLNEGSFPSFSSKGSYIPFNIRKAYSLPTVEHQDAMYSYLFYRTLQRAENIHLFYNTETDRLGEGEMSRYLQQLIYESGLPLTKHTLYNPVEPTPEQVITIQKNDAILQKLKQLNEPRHKSIGFSPSSLYMYLECRLKFFFSHIADIKEPKEVEEELDARVLGNLLHDVMDRFYRELQEYKKSRLVEYSDFENYKTTVDTLIDKAFIKTYTLDPAKKVEYEGHRVVVREVIRRLVHQIVMRDRAYAPFAIEGLEQGGLTAKLDLEQQPGYAIISGKIDRIDLKEDVLRIIDYKTGGDDIRFTNVELLFGRDGKKLNKAAFQTLFYALLYQKSMPGVLKHGTVKIRPVLINRLNLFDEEFEYGLRQGNNVLKDANPILPTFEIQLKKLFDELFDPAVPFSQTTKTDQCKFCPYKAICNR